LIILKTVTIKNFMSIGAVSQTVDLTQHGLTLVLGENLDLGGNDARNGVGKCLRGSTKIDIKFSDENTEKKFKEFMKNKR